MRLLHNIVLIYTNIPGLKDKVEAIKNKEFNVIVCVNMLGEGFDLPELKIAAIHDERQSIPVTLQFIGRFTRTSFAELGNASFITNIAYPPIQKELDLLYSKDSDWNTLLPKISEVSTEKEINFQEFLNGFDDVSSAKIPFQSMNPAMSCKVYKNLSGEWSPEKWQEGIGNINDYEHQYSNINTQKKVLVIILGKVTKVEWANFDVVQNISWDNIIVYWNNVDGKNLVFVHTSLKSLNTDSLIKSIFGDRNSLIDGMDVFKIFHEVNRLKLYNVGAKKGIGKDVSFQSFFGKNVQDGIDQLLAGTLIKNNIFGIGFKNGNQISLGCSAKGKVWSYLRGNLEELITWCKQVGNILDDPNISSNLILENTLIPKVISERPNNTIPIYVDWDPIMYKFPEHKYNIIINNSYYDLSNTELNVIQSAENEHLKFSLDNDDFSIGFELELNSRTEGEENIPYYKVNKISAEDVKISHGNRTKDIVEFFQEYTPSIWFADGSQLIKNNHIELRNQPDQIPSDNIIPINWNGIDINVESQGMLPYKTNSIQYNLIQMKYNDYDIIYDDDGSNEMADIVAINNKDEVIEVHLYHLKYSKKSKKADGTYRSLVNNDISNFYEVCGQAQKSISWKYRESKFLFDHLLRRITKTKRNHPDCSRIIKGTEDDLESLLTAAKWTKPLKFHIYIVQPSLSKQNASEDILLLLGNTYHYLKSVAGIELIVHCSQ